MHPTHRRHLEQDPEAKAKAEENERKRQAVLADRKSAVEAKERKVAERLQMRREAEAALERTIDDALAETRAEAQTRVKKVVGTWAARKDIYRDQVRVARVWEA